MSTTEPASDPAGQNANPASDLRDEELSYEAAREQLGQIVATLESGGASLAESMELWERGEKLAATCQRWLDGARAKVDAARRSAEEDAPDMPF